MLPSNNPHVQFEHQKLQNKSTGVKGWTLQRWTHRSGWYRRSKSELAALAWTWRCAATWMRWRPRGRRGRRLRAWGRILPPPRSRTRWCTGPSALPPPWRWSALVRTVASLQHQPCQEQTRNSMTKNSTQNSKSKDHQRPFKDHPPDRIRSVSLTSLWISSCCCCCCCFVLILFFKFVSANPGLLGISGNWVIKIDRKQTRTLYPVVNTIMWPYSLDWPSHVEGYLRKPGAGEANFHRADKALIRTYRTSYCCFSCIFVGQHMPGCCTKWRIQGPFTDRLQVG